MFGWCILSASLYVVCVYIYILPCTVAFIWTEFGCCWYTLPPALQVQFASYKQFCDDTTVEKDRAITEANQRIEVLKADIQKHTYLLIIRLQLILISLWHIILLTKFGRLPTPGLPN